MLTKRRASRNLEQVKSHSDEKGEWIYRLMLTRERYDVIDVDRTDLMFLRSRKESVYVLIAAWSLGPAELSESA